jgi:chromosome condensin MukBEF ATPase and DNA-binding subunit MukB
VDRTIVVALIAGVPGLLAAFLVYRSSSSATDVNARAAELGWVKELRQDTIDAREEVVQLRTEVRELRRQLDVVTREADHWIAEHQSMRRHAQRPGMTIERLRELIGPMDPPAAAANGR